MKRKNITPQLPLGVHPLTIPVREGLNVAFLVSEKNGKGRNAVVRYGTIVWCQNGTVVVEDIAAPGSRYNRSIEQVYEAHIEAQLTEWVR